MADEVRDDGPVLHQLNLVVSDMATTLAFYRRLGVAVDDVDDTWRSHHVTAPMPDGVDMDLDSITFASRWDQGWPGGPGTVIGFRVASREAVDRIFGELVGAGHHAQQAPYDAFWGARYAVVEDPDGRAVGLMSPSDAAHRSAPPDPSA
jgi:uncharacterized glyoxalase superfamily protein PhnB